MHTRSRSPRWLRGALALAVAFAIPSFARAQTMPCAGAKFTASDAEPNSGFGPLAISGDTAVIGAQGDDVAVGAAYVRVRQGSSWVETQKLTASDGAAGAYLGNAVDIDGDTLVVAAWADNDPVINAGAAYVFEKSGGTWVESAKLMPPDPAEHGHFGYSASLDGDTVAIGRVPNGVSPVTTRFVYVFVRSGGTWSLEAQLVSPGVQTPIWFGAAVALEGDTLVVGDARTLASTSGRAYVFRRTGGVWTHVAELSSDVPTIDDAFGSSVALAGDRIVVGAPRAIGAAPDTGAVYVFRESGGTWSLESKLFQPIAETTGEDAFGWSLATDGTRLLVGAPSHDVQPVGALGSAYVYDRHGTTWVRSATLASPEPFESSSGVRDFGTSVALEGEHVLVGAWNGLRIAPNTGYVYAYGPSPHARLCFGDGSLANPCPCAAPNTVPSPSGAPGAGCAASFNLDGGRLTACGGVAQGTLRFFAELRGNFGNFAALVKGNVADASGIASGDGLRCAAGQLIRFGGHLSGTNGDAFGAWSYPNTAQTISVSAATLQPPAQRAYYQVFFRSALPSFCNPSTFNITNAVEVVW